MEAWDRRIEDVGEVIPFARKHIARDGVFQTRRIGEITLKEIWPEPDWATWVEEGVEPDAAAFMAMIYEGISPVPVKSMFQGVITDEMWKEAYVEALAALQRIFDGVWTMDRALTIEKRFSEELGIDFFQLNETPITQKYRLYALSRSGGRTLKSLTCFTRRQRALALWLPKLGWPMSDAALKEGKFPIELADETWRIGRARGIHHEVVGNEVYLSEEEAVLALIKELGVLNEVRQSRVPVKPGGAKIKRVGPDWRGGEDVSAERLMKDFGFRGVQFGASLSQRERQRWMNEVYDALADMSKVLLLERKLIGGGKQALSIGARGLGGFSHSAHYERSLKVVSLTRSKGAGSFAHEWAHAFDNLLCERIFGMDGYLSHFISMGMQPNVSSHSLYLSMEKIVEQIYGMTNGRSKFYKDAQAIKGERRAGGYWVEAEELFARGFEAFIQDTLLGSEIVSPWLVYGTRAEDYDLEKIAGCPYPTGMERIVLNDLYSDLITQVHQIQAKRASGKKAFVLV